MKVQYARGVRGGDTGGGLIGGGVGGGDGGVLGGNGCASNGHEEVR